ncbi:MAG: hypothetical protein IJ506_04185 [Clostridia bacterium]|nr:hypothetical protein [Clostridia bacterium]
MILYVCIIVGCILLFAALNALVFDWSFLAGVGWTSGAVIAVILVDAIVASACRLSPAKWYNHNSKIYTVGRKEKNFYEKLKIRKWKDKIPEIGHFTGFRKNKLDDPTSVEYVERFLLESCYGEAGHLLSCLLGFVIMIPFPFLPRGWWLISLLVGIVNVLMNLPSLFVLRYNSYKLEILYKRNLKRQMQTA